MSQQDEQPEIEVLPARTRETPPDDDGGRAVQKGKQNIIIGTLNVFADPARGAFLEPIERRYFKHYQPTRPHGRWHMIVDTLLFLAVAGLVIYNLVLYAGYGKSLLPGVRFSVERAGELASGQAVTYTISYTNENKEQLEGATIALRLPQTIRDVVVEPKEGYNTKTKTWNIGTIGPGMSSTLTVRGHVLGASTESVLFGAMLSYTPEGAKRAEYVLATDEAAIARSALTLKADTPARVIHKQPMTVTLRYKNEGVVSLEHVALRPEFPEGFTLERTEPVMKKGEFLLGPIAGDAEGIITITGALDARGQDVVTIPVRAVVREQTRDIDQGEIAITIPIFYPQLKLGLTIDTPSIHPGEETTYTVSYENGESVDILDATVAIEFPKAFLDDATFASDTGIREASTVRFTKKTQPALALIKPKTKGGLTFTVASRTSFDQRILFPQGNTKLSVTISGSYRMEPRVEDVIPVTTIVALPVGAALQLQSFARYYTNEGEQLGRGPMPPIVGKTTRYWVFWNIVNAVNEVNAVVVRGHLPEGVTWTGRTSTTYGDAVKFDPATNTVLWNIDVVKRETGGIYPDVGASFEVALTPDASRIGKTASLLTKQSIQGQDIVTKETIERDATDITTALPHDPLAKGKGLVRAP